MTKLEKYVDEENAYIKRRVLKMYGRNPLAGELIDLSALGSRTKLAAHFEALLEPEVLHQDGERPAAEAKRECTRLTGLLNELNKLNEDFNNGRRRTDSKRARRTR